MSLKSIKGYFDRRNPGAPRWRVLWWELICLPLSWVAMFLLYRHRWWGVRNVPDRGPVLLLCNHQSYLDLLVLGIGLDRRHFHSMARASLFRNRLFAWLIRSLNAFPVEQGRSDIRSVRTAIDKLKRGHLVLIFPEGGRTHTGRMQPLSPGLLLLIRRARPTVVPMAVDGVFDIWPPFCKSPKLLGQTGALYGKPIAADALLAMTPEAAVTHLQHQMERLRLDLRHRLRRLTEQRYPPPGPGDEATFHSAAAADVEPARDQAMTSTQQVG